MANIRDCFESTDWDLFFNDFNCCNDHELLNDTITSYIIFVQRLWFKLKNVSAFPNNTPWINKHLKQSLNKKKIVFLRNETHKVKELNKEVKRMIKEA